MANYELFNTIEELYERVLPAIHTKIKEFNRNKITNIHEKDIWNYCVTKKWNNKQDLRLYQLVDDILNMDYLDIYNFLNTKKGRI